MSEVGGAKRTKKGNAWLTHVKRTMKSHKGKKFGDILKMAKKTYKGGADVEGSPSLSSGPMSPAPVGGRRTRKGRRGSRKSRRGGMEY